MSIWFHNEWHIYRNVIDKKTCDKIISLAQGRWQEPTIEDSSMGEFTKEERIIGRKSSFIQDRKVRKSDVYWTEEQWLYDLIWPLMLGANKAAGWNLDISAAESMQLTRYKKGGLYGWHKDGSSDSLSTYDWPENSFLHNNVRKLSLSLILNDNFEGGDFEFACYDKEKCEITPIELKRGDMMFFTSGMEHRVTPITKGVRCSLVSWFVGPPIR